MDDFRDIDGNVLAVLLGINEEKILLEGIYGQNLDSPVFYSDVVFSKINDWAPDYSIQRIFLNFSLCLEIMDKWKEIKLKISPDFVIEC